MENSSSPKFSDERLAPMHSAEHILNQTMVRMFGCPRSKNTHVERKKSKCDYLLQEAPTAEQIAEIEERVNRVIAQNLPITVSFMSKKEAKGKIDLSKLPPDVTEPLRVVNIGYYDSCACAGTHVQHSGEIGRFTISSSSYSHGIWRVRFKLST